MLNGITMTLENAHGYKCNKLIFNFINWCLSSFIKLKYSFICHTIKLGNFKWLITYIPKHCFITKMLLTKNAYCTVTEYLMDEFH